METQEAPTRDRNAQVAALAERARELFEIPGLAVAVVFEGEVVVAEGFGERELGAGVAVDAETSFQIASNTKAFIATSVGLLVAEGQLDWDDRVSEHLPDLVLWDEQVTRELRVRDLLSHRSGLATWAGDMLWISSSFERETVLARLQHVPAAYGLRERFGYSNLMYILAGELIRAKTGQPWEAFVRARLLEPLGMDAVATTHAELDGKTNLAQPHIEVEGSWQTTPRLDLGVAGAIGSLDASVLDLSKWLRMQLSAGEYEGQRLVPEAVIRETRTPHIFLPVSAGDIYDPPRHLRAYGLGWNLEDYRGKLVVAHGGGLPGMTSRVLMVPEAKLGIVVLTNSESPASALLALQIADLFLTDAPGKDYLGAYVATQAERTAEAEVEAADAEGQSAEAPLPPGLEGNYASPLLGAARIVREGDVLVFEAHEHGGLRCRFEATATATDTDTGTAGELRAPCRWDDPNMGVSEVTLEPKGKRVASLRFRVRPDFYDPLEYVFARTR